MDAKSAINGYLLLGLLLICASLLLAVVLWVVRPRFWPACLGVLVTGASLLLFMPIRLALPRESIFDQFDDGFGIIVEFLLFTGFVGLIHFVLLTIVVVELLDAVEGFRKVRSGTPSHRRYHSNQ